MGSRVVVLGGCGGVGRTAVAALAATGAFDEIVVADAREEGAREVAGEIPGGSAAVFDAAEAASVKSVVAGATVVLNCVGPFYRFGPPILEAVIASGIDYVDICDDLAPTRRMLEMDDAARQAGVTAVIGMGNSPGLANLMVRMCADQLLDEVESADIMHIHGGEPDEGPAVIKHRIAAVLDDIPVFINGAFQTVRQLEPSGEAFVADTEFRDLGPYPVYPYPHPETITLPRHIKGLRRVTNRGVVFPLSYFELIRTMAAVGACGEEPLAVGDTEVIPIDFAVALIRARRPQLLEEAGVTGPAGCLKVEVRGRKDGEPHTYIFSVSSTSAGASEGTGIPAALGAVLVGRGDVPAKGVLPPEAAIDPMALMALAGGVSLNLGVSGGDLIHLEHILPDGTSESERLTF